MNERIIVDNLSKVYKLYNNPLDRLKEAINPMRKKYHRDYYALRDISFKVKRGENLGVIGKNGSGKSTLLKILTGVLTATTGNITINGRVSSLLELGAGFNPEYTGIENIYFNGTIMGYTKPEMDEKLDDILSFANIGDYIYQPIKNYSSGMFVRLAFAAAVSVNPEILIVDEALSVGDIFFQQKCHERMEELIASGVTIIAVSHDMSAIAKYSTAVLLLDQGHCLFQGRPDEAVHRYLSLVESSHVESKRISHPAIEKTTVNTDKFTSQHSPLEDWPSENAFLDISNAVIVGCNDIARLTRMALCNERGQPCVCFQTGDMAYFYFEFEFLQDIEVPVAGIAILNHLNIVVHSKTSMHHLSEVPYAVRKCSRLRFRQRIELALAPGDYTFIIPFTILSPYDYDHLTELTMSQIESRMHPGFRVRDIGRLSITVRSEGFRLPFYGYVDLKGDSICELIEDQCVN